MQKGKRGNKMRYIANIQQNQLNKASQHSWNKTTAGQKGFTLIELMIVVVIIGILGSIAIPSYSEYVKRGKAAEATSNLANLKIRMEQYFQDNKTYEDTGGFTAPCSPSAAEAQLFTYSCTTQTATNFTLTASAISGKGIDGFEYTVNEANAKTSKFDGNVGLTCWLSSKTATC